MRKLFAVAMALVLLLTMSTWGDPSDTRHAVAASRSTVLQTGEFLTPEEATQIAFRHLVAESVSLSHWVDATLGPPVEHYDLAGNLSAYVFSVLGEDGDVGHITISATRLPNPVLEFSAGQARHGRARTTADQIAVQRGLSTRPLVPLYLGPLSYFYEIAGESPRLLVDMCSGQQLRISGQTPSIRHPQHDVPDLSRYGAIEVAYVRSRDLHTKLLDVPDYDQYCWPSGSNPLPIVGCRLQGGCHVGCCPTAAGNVMGYWSDREYPNLMDGGSEGDYQSTINALREYMGTWCEDDIGWNNPKDIASGILNYTSEKGYDFTVRWTQQGPTNEAFDWYAFEIDADRPTVVAFRDSTFCPDGCTCEPGPGYDDHAVTGVGYHYDSDDPNFKYMIIHDNRACSQDNVFLQFGAGYSSLVFDSIIPPSHTPPPPPPPPPSTDGATFLSHITLPDGSAVSPGQALVKTWRVRNSGTSTWSDYKLRFVGGDRLDASTETSIPTTGPQGTVDISINLTAPTQPGNYSGYFQIVNASGTEVPGGRLWVKISVQAEESRITFYFDPPSPSAANDVHITAKAEGISNVRAMRLLIDGQIVSELGSTYVDANWDTRPYADGLHSIVAQVAFHGDDGWAYPEQRGVSYELLPGREPVNKAPPPADAHPTRRLAR